MVKLIFIFVDAIKSPLIQKLVTSSFIIRCQGLRVKSYGYVKSFIWETFIPYMKVEILPCRAARARGTHSQVFLFWIKIKNVLAQLETCSFMKGMPQKSVHLRASLPPTMVRAVTKVNKFYLHWFFFRRPLWKMVRQTCCRGVQFTLSNNQVFKKSALTKS